MSNIKYGLISETDARTLEKTIDLLLADDSHNYPIKITEIGIYSGETMKGLVEYIAIKGRSSDTTGVDNFKDGQDILFSYYGRIIKGNSNEVYNQIEDDSQHLIFVDGCHCFAHVVSDFFCYAPKVKVGGYMAFHDTGKHIKPFKDFQHGDKNNPDAYISVRKALQKIGLIDNINVFHKEVWNKFMAFLVGKENTGALKFELVFDEADETNEAGGITVFKKLY